MLKLMSIIGIKENMKRYEIQVEFDYNFRCQK